eukprot:Nitzschia sp. Nitz4//scaffold155_size52807//30018//30416//NITZ4_006800-RA/size52807-processed-gene-0.19-mRNA-1//-1//CDS//3329537381//6106//frame0
MDSQRICIQATYRIHKPDDENSVVETAETFGPASSCTNSVTTPLRIGLPTDSPYPPPRPEAGDERYSGLHDAGPLPPLQEDGPMAVLMQCAVQAKQFNDNFLTEQIAAAKASTPSNSQDTHPSKRAKVQEGN